MTDQNDKTATETVLDQQAEKNQDIEIERALEQEPAALQPNHFYNGKRGKYDHTYVEPNIIEEFGPEPQHKHEQAQYWKTVADFHRRRALYHAKLAHGRGQAAWDRQAEKEELRLRHMDAHKELEAAHRTINELENLLGSSNAGQVAHAVGMDNPQAPSEDDAVEQPSYTRSEVEDIVLKYEKIIKFVDQYANRMSVQVKFAEKMIGEFIKLKKIAQKANGVDSMSYANGIATIGYLLRSIEDIFETIDEIDNEGTKVLDDNFPEHMDDAEGFEEWRDHQATQKISNELREMFKDIDPDLDPRKIRFEKMNIG